MNKSQPKIFLYIGVISLFIIGGIVLSGTLQGRYSFFMKKGQGSFVLGIADKLPFSKINSGTFENIFEKAVSSSKDEISKKVIEAEGKIKSNLEKEVSEMTDQQIKSIKLRICRDWGVVKD